MPPGRLAKKNNNINPNLTPDPACAALPEAPAAVPPTPERAERVLPARRAPRLPRFKLPFVELPERAPPNPGLHYLSVCWA